MRGRRGRGSGVVGIFFLAVIVVLAGCGYYLYTSKIFERNAPVINLSNQIYWNLKSSIPLIIKDDTGIKSAKVSLSDGSKKINLIDTKFDIIKPEVKLEISLPKGTLLDKSANYQLEIEANDVSKWNFFTGNKLDALINVAVDTQRPDIYVLNQSYKITRGGAAAVVFRASDEMLKELYIETNAKKQFKVTPFHKDGYYASLVAWPASEDSFSAYVIAKDMAGNENRTRIKYYLQDKKYKVSNIALNDEFLGGKITDLVNRYAQDPSQIQGVAKFKFVNETLRNQSEGAIGSKTKDVLEDSLNKFFLKPFYPLKNGQAVASFGDHRFYSMNKEPVSESWHLGLDLASIAGAPIIASNDGEVVFADEDGIYGLGVAVYHGFGLYSLYAHCSSSNVKVGDKVKAGEVIAHTGSSGLAFGDHLHFGVIIQGVEVRPEEWMDKKWMEDNIYKILENSRKSIDSRK
ncbi:M23 family metallopeptidase [Campylobacter geochelonis]|uniref:Peptidase M23B n=1 Tax=Campylobacter geochelonis TaxID=1780362 RepID=A0A128EKD9_9BACT|nr:M23 family metallopeptidase [Campylobacter geochelonis]QKF70722.1 zinc metallopeptidase, M23 family [Campylobacter geochelonis]CZE49415.1 peptidase M23B [Campylobacter geochelonis]